MVSNFFFPSFFKFFFFFLFDFEIFFHFSFEIKLQIVFKFFPFFFFFFFFFLLVASNIFITSFQQFNYNVLWYVFLCVYLASDSSHVFSDFTS